MYIVYNSTKREFVLRFPQYVQNAEKKTYLYNIYLNKKLLSLRKINDLSPLELENIRKIIGWQLLRIGQEVDLKIVPLGKIKKVLILKKKLSTDIWSIQSYCIRSKRKINSEIKKIGR